MAEPSLDQLLRRYLTRPPCGGLTTSELVIKLDEEGNYWHSTNEVSHALQRMRKAGEIVFNRRCGWSRVKAPKGKVRRG